MLNYVRGREARPASRNWNLIKTLAQTMVFWSVFLFLLPAAIVILEHRMGWGRWHFGTPAFRWVGGALFLLGGALGLTSGMVMAVRGRGTPLPADCPNELVVAGPYRYIRNTMVIAGLSQGFAVGIFLGSPAVVTYALLGAPIWHLFVRPWEEADLEQRFGAPYRRYRAEVRCWLPRFPAYAPSSEEMTRDSVS
jgi:protein-S-isoprenylcysteine O-methyltransferase Ste14